MSVTAIIPLKALSAAKGRLAGVFSPVDRRTFTAWMATQVITACRACDAIDEIVVVAGDEEAADVARRAAVDVIVVAQPGLDAALAAADALTVNREATLVVAADLPQLTAEDLSAVVAAGPRPAAVVIAPTRDGGTGALLRRPPTAITTAYGPGSAAEHQRRAEAAGAATAVVHRTGLASDVDTPSDLPAALALAAEQDVGCAPA